MSKVVDGAVEEELHPAPLTAAEAATLRQSPEFQQGAVSMALVLKAQVLAGLFVAVLAWLVSQKLVSSLSAIYGMLAVVIPGVIFVRGLQRWQCLSVSGAGGSGSHAGGMLAGFFVWELVKIILTVVMLALAPKMVAQLDWLALLAGFVVTLKMHWLALWRATKSPKNQSAVNG